MLASRFPCLTLLAAFVLSNCGPAPETEQTEQTVPAPKFEPTWESIRTHEVPE